MQQKYIRYSPQSSLTDSDVLDMRTAFAAGATSAEDLASMYGINESTAQRIVSGQTWSHVPSPKSIINGKYQVYPDGRIFSNSARKFLSERVNADGQLVVELRANGKREVTSVAYLVARSFISSSLRSIKNVAFTSNDTTDAHFTNLMVTGKSAK